MIRIKRVYDPVSAGEGKRILIDRLWPRGIKKENAHVDEWIKDIAPSDDLRKWFSHDLTKWQEFKKRYISELKAKSDLMARILSESKKGTVTLLFAAKDIEHNNAVVLKDILGRKHLKGAL